MATTFDAILKIATQVVGAENLTKLSSGIRGVEQVAKNADAALGGVGNVVRGLTGGIAALGVGLSAAGIVTFAKGAIDAADDLRDLSQQTGASVESLSRFQQMANMSGASIDDVGKAMVKLNRNMVVAATTGKGPAAEALQELGLSATDAAGRLIPADEQMLRISERFAQMEDGGKKTALAVDLLGKSGANMIPMLNEGRQAIAGLNATLSTEFADKADAYNDSLSAMGAVFGQIGTEIAGQLLPYLSSAVDWLAKVGIGFRDWIVGNREPIRQTIETIATVGQALGPWVVGIGAVVGAYKVLTEALKAAAVAQAILQGLSGPAGWAQLALAAGLTAGAVWGINEAMKGAKASTTEAELEAQKLAAGMTGVKMEAEAIAPPVEKAKFNQEAFNGAIEQSNDQYQRLNATIEATSQVISLNEKLSAAVYTADLAINNTAKQILQTKLGLARTDAEKIGIIGQIMALELEAARLQRDAAVAQIESEVTIADLKRQSAWAELRKADAALATARAISAGTDAEKERIRAMERGLELAKQTANAADREFVTTDAIADQRVRAINTQFRLSEFQARAAAQAATLQAREAGDRAARLGEFFLSEVNTAGGSVQGQQYRTRRTSTGGSVSELVSFAGGGFTGNGPRSGGLDGHGGYLAMVHPQEQIIDLARSAPRDASAGVPRSGGTFAPVFNLSNNGPVYRLPDGTDAVSLADAQAMVADGIGQLWGHIQTYDGRKALGIA